MNLSTENTLLLYCVQTRITKDTLDYIKGLQSLSLDWEEVLRFAFSNDIAPLLYHNLKKIQESHFIPQEVVDRLRKAYYGNLAKNMYIYGELKRILDVFREEEIEVIVLKGASLAETVYGNVGLRCMNDIDLLVKKEVLDRSDELMAELGYISDESRHSKDWYRKNHRHLAPFLSQDNKIKIEIHHDIIPPENPFRIDIRKSWDRAQSNVIGDINTLVLSPEDLIVHLCLHSFYLQPLKKGLRNLVDISQVVRFYGERINWDRIIREAHEGNFTNFIYYPLCLARDILGMEVRREIFDALKTGSNIGLFEDYLLGQITKKNVLLRDHSSSIIIPDNQRLRHTLCKELLRETHVRNKLRSLLKIIFLPRTESSEKSSQTSIQKLSCFFCLVLHISKLIFKLCYCSSKSMIKCIFHKTVVKLAR
ncbi:MAG: nucleotidyltransferase family protein [Candidatus Scalinduaceae bacterium]